eukprot:TRINITY_DN30933_c0_g1_i1.p3 TRINITY_DN30933_c0_g1~~TRINITY_DN30933_c0_g1_i1.p3  ORF type:complete len:123 (+),score=34.56 TRINITY_DN30933_c0_g1_i1:39-371(+)
MEPPLRAGGGCRAVVSPPPRPRECGADASSRRPPDASIWAERPQGRGPAVGHVSPPPPDAPTRAAQPQPQPPPPQQRASTSPRRSDGVPAATRHYLARTWKWNCTQQPSA